MKHTVMVALGALMMAGLTGCNEDGKDKAAAQQKPAQLPVKVMKMQKRDIDVRETWFGHLRGVNQTNIRPEVSGKIISVEYKDGELRKKGDVLFKIDPSAYEATVNQCNAALKTAEAAVKQAEVALEIAVKDVERFDNLAAKKQGAISEKDHTDAKMRVEAAGAALEAARAQVEQAKAAKALAEINLERCTITAPFDGLVSQSNVSVGDFVAPGGVVLASMSSVAPIRVDFVVPGKHMLNKIKAPEFDGESGFVSPINDFRVILEDGSVFSGADGQPILGKVVSVDSEVNASTGTVNFVGHIPNPGLRLRSGSAVRVDAKTGTVKDALLVPSRALVSAMNHHYLFVVAPNGEPCGLDVKPGHEMVLDMPNGDGTTTPMLMQEVTGTTAPISAMLQHYGINDPEEAQVIVEGGLQAAMLAKQNAIARQKGAKDGFATVIPTPFVYAKPQSTTPSVTAKPKATEAPAPAEETSAKQD